MSKLLTIVALAVVLAVVSEASVLAGRGYIDVDGN
jgi:hypothetical protein